MLTFLSTLSVVEDALSVLCQSVLLLSFSNYFKSSTAAVKELLLQVAQAKDTVEVIKSEERCENVS